MKTGEKARAKGNASRGAGPESGRDVGKTIDRARHFLELPLSTKKRRRQPHLTPPRDTLFGKSRRKDKIIDGQYNSD
jgi:hypothetical protein